MNTQISATAAASVGTSAPEFAGSGRARSPWYESIWFALAISLIAGFSYALLVMGPQPLNPRNVNWVAFDPAYHYVGWELFRQDPHVHWPLTYTDRIGYPQGESIALLDLNPLLALLLKPVSFLLPEPAQYFGLEVILVCTLQFFFAFRLFQLLLDRASRLDYENLRSVPQGLKPTLAGHGTARLKPAPDTKQALWNLLSAALCSAFFLLAPPLNYRFWGHYSLSNQWLLVASLFTLAQAQQPSPKSERRFVISAAVLMTIAFGINPYIAVPVALLLAAGVVALLWQKRINTKQATAIFAVLVAAGFAMAYLVGFVIGGGKGYSSGGYRDFSMNLLAPFDPRGWHSLLFARLSEAVAGQYEGYSYLGAGVLIIAAVAVVAAIIRRKKIVRPDKRWLVPLACSCLLLTLLAVSTRITMGAATVVDFDPGGKLSHYFAPLRASGRLFWGPYYAILAAILAAPFLFFRRAWANLLIGCMLIVQFADTASLRQWVHTTISEDHPSPLKSPIWSQLGALHQNLVVLPAWQCAKNASPGGPEGYRIFGFLAVRQKMRINSYQSARYTGVAQDFHCSQAPAELTQRPLAADSAYVVTPEIAAAIAQGPTGPGKCHDLDGFILCSTRTDFGLSPILMTPEQRVEDAIANPDFEDGTASPWSTNGVKAAASSVQAHGGTYSLAESGGAGTVYQDINGLQPGATYTVSAWASALPGAATAQIIVYDPTDNVSVSSRAMACDPRWQRLSRSFIAGREGAVRIHLARGQGSTTVYWDDVHLSPGKELR